jgi:hypothetical protein
MIMKKRIILKLFLFTVTIAKGQDQWNIGKKVTDVKFTQMLNYKSSTARLKDFLGKPLIICWWFSGCSDAVQFVPYLDSMSKQLRGKLNVLMASLDNEKQIKAVFATPPFASVTIPMTIADTAFKQHFPHRVEPHIIWIDKNGVIKSVTSKKEVSPQNLTSFAHGITPKLALKEEVLDPQVFFTLTPLAVNEYPKYESGMRYSFYLGGYRTGIAGQFQPPFYHKETGIVRARAINTSAYKLFLLVNGIRNGFHNNRILTPQNLTWESIAKQKFCLDAYIRDTSKVLLYALIKNDVEQSLGLKSGFGKAKMKVWVITMTSDTQNIRTKYAKPELPFTSNGITTYRKIKFETIVENANTGSATPYPLLDETRFPHYIDISVAADMSSLSALNSSLKPYGVVVIETEREIEVLRIQPISTKSF